MMSDRPMMRHKQGTVSLLTILTIIGIVAIALMIAAGYRKTPDQSGSVTWRTDLAAAMRESSQNGRPVLVDFTASWCPPCQRMKSEVWTDARIASAANTKFIPVLIDVDEQPGIARQYDVGAIPTLMIMKDGKPAYQRTGFHDVADLQAILRDNGR